MVWRCPKSIITAESQTLLEEYLIRKRLGRIEVDGMSARQAEAFTVLEREAARERRYGQQNTRRDASAIQ
jgi:hypothetical protein